MARLDFKRGRFTSDYETTRIQSGLLGWQASTYGDTVQWYVSRPDLSVVNSIYDEGDGIGKVFDGPFAIPVLHVNHLEGGSEELETGFYFNDELHITGNFVQMERSGLPNLDIGTKEYLLDRIVYDQKVFRITRIEILGQITNRDIIVAIDATQMKPDELVNDQQFAAWAGLPGGY